MSIETPQGLTQEVLSTMSARFFDEAVCTGWFLDRHYPNGPACPECGTPITNERALQSFRQNARFTCPSCGRQPRATKGTILEGSHLSPRELIVICWMIALDADSASIARTVGLSAETVRTWRERIHTIAEVSA